MLWRSFYWMRSDGQNGSAVGRQGKLATYACRCIENELLMMFRSREKTSREVSLFESIGTDKEGNEINLLDAGKGSRRMWWSR